MSRKTYELIGVKVKEKQEKITYAGKHAGKKGYHLLIEADNRPEIKMMKAFPDSVGLAGSVSQEQIGKDIEESNYADKRYLFYYQLENRSYYLVGGKEI